MKRSSFNHLSNFICDKRIGLGWLAGVFAMETDKAVTTDWHRHDTTEMLFSIRGEKNYEFRDGHKVTLYPGAYLIVPAGCEHRVSNAVDEPGRRLGLSLKPACSPRRKFAVFSASDYRSFLAAFERSARQTRHCPPRMKRDLEELNRLIQQEEFTSAELGYVRILCCSILYAAILPQESHPVPSARIMDEAVRWLTDHFAEKVSVDRLAAHMGYSRARLFTLFKNHTGVSPNDYLVRLRIGKAKDMLSSGSLQAKDIATACGFSDAQYFSRMFKRQTGLTPQAYRIKRPLSPQPSTGVIGRGTRP